MNAYVDNIKHSQNGKYDDKIFVLRTHEWKPGFHMSKVDQLYDIISVLFETPLTEDETDLTVPIKPKHD